MSNRCSGAVWAVWLTTAFPRMPANAIAQLSASPRSPVLGQCVMRETGHKTHALSHPDDLLGGMWAVIATVFVCRYSYHQSVTAAVTRMSATTVSFVFCLVYLIFLPFHAWALAVLIGASALAVILIGRPGDAITAGITTAVILVVAAISPQPAGSSPSSASRTQSWASPSGS